MNDRSSGTARITSSFFEQEIKKLLHCNEFPIEHAVEQTNDIPVNMETINKNEKQNQFQTRKLFIFKALYLH